MPRSISSRRGPKSHGLVSDTRPCPGRSRLDGSGDSLGRVDERVAEITAERVPRFDPLSRCGEQSLGVDRMPLLFVDPALHLLERHLGMELDAPRVVAEPEGLRTHAV